MSIKILTTRSRYGRHCHRNLCTYDHLFGRRRTSVDMDAYRSKQKTQGSLSENERAELETLAMQAERMLERIDTLEAILDAQTPEWRKRNGVE